MTHDELVAHFGDEAKARVALGKFRGSDPISRQQAHYWKAHGIPRSVQCEFQILTGGALQAARAPEAALLRPKAAAR
jgi:hypothetical protein